MHKLLVMDSFILGQWIASQITIRWYWIEIDIAIDQTDSSVHLDWINLAYNFTSVVDWFD